MFFKKEYLSFEVIDVIDLNQKNVSVKVAGRNFHALSFRLNSKATMKANNTTYKMNTGDLCFASLGMPFSRISEYDKLIAVHFLAPALNQKEFTTFSANSPEIFERLFCEILKINKEKQPDYKYRRAAVFNQILAECYLQNHTDNRQDSKIYASYDYIKRNFANPEITVKEAAEKSFMSEVYFRKLFKAEHGISPREYIINLRINNAIRLMETGCYTLGEIARLSGWNDYRYFTTEFKRKTGVSPSNYR